MLPSICQVFSPILQLPSCCNEQAMLPTMRASGQRILISLPWPVQKPCCACRLARLAPQQGRCSTGSCSTWLQTWKPRSLLSRSVLSLSLRPACSPCMCHVCHGRAWGTVSGPRRCSCRCRAALCMEFSECCPVAHTCVPCGPSKCVLAACCNLLSPCGPSWQPHSSPAPDSPRDQGHTQSATSPLGISQRSVSKRAGCWQQNCASLWTRTYVPIAARDLVQLASAVGAPWRGRTQARQGGP